MIYQKGHKHWVYLRAGCEGGNQRPYTAYCGLHFVYCVCAKQNQNILSNQTLLVARYTGKVIEQNSTNQFSKRKNVCSNNNVNILSTKMMVIEARLCVGWLADRSVWPSGMEPGCGVSVLDDYMRYAHGLVSEYLSDSLSGQLRDSMGYVLRPV